MRVSMWAVMLLWAGVIGCADDGPCDEPRGVYRIAFEPETGTCEDFEYFATINSEDDSESSCEGSEKWSDDMCYSEADIQCPLENGSGETTGTIALVGAIYGNEAATRYEGSADIFIESSAGSCRSVGRLTYTKQ